MNTKRGVYTIFFSDFYSSALILASKSPFEAEPTCLSTSLPSLKKSKVGILRILYSALKSASSSTLYFPIITLPSYSSASSSTEGAALVAQSHLR